MSRKPEPTTRSVKFTFTVRGNDGKAHIDFGTMVLITTNFRLAVAQVQRALVKAALFRARGNKCRAAHDLGLHRNVFTRYMKLLGVE